MNEDCKWYQQNERFMAFLTDCVVIAIITGHYHFPPVFKSVCEIYKNTDPEYVKADVFEDHMLPHPVLSDDVVGQIGDTVRSETHGNHNGRPSTALSRATPGSVGTEHALLELQALCNKI